MSNVSRVNFKRSPTVQRFHESKAFFRGIKGPVGSGKSVGCCFEIFHLACNQAPNNNGIRKTRHIVVRDTSPELETTTIKTWLDWFPEDVYGKMGRKPPFTQIMRFGLPDNTVVKCEIIFLALDRPEDEKKLLSLECTSVWFNEAKFTQKNIIDAATGRVGRYPSAKEMSDEVISAQVDAAVRVASRLGGAHVLKFLHANVKAALQDFSLPGDDVSADDFRKEIVKEFTNFNCLWPSRSGIIADTNPPPDTHWWYDFAENDGWLKDPVTGDVMEIGSIPEIERWAFFSQPGGRSPDAENIENLPANYYQLQMMGKDVDYIKVMVDGEYGQIVSGLPVYRGSFNKDIHVSSDPFKMVPGRKVTIGVDCSGRNPSAVFIQTDSAGMQFRVFHEIVCQDVNAHVFSSMLSRYINSQLIGCDVELWGDPAGGFKSINDEQTYFQIIKKITGHQVRPSPVMREKPRIEAVQNAFLRLVDGGRPALCVSPKCKVLIAGFNGGYRYRKLNVSGETRYAESVDKTRYSDVQDALQYGVCGLGEYKQMVSGDKRNAAKPQRNAANISSWQI